ncbi:HNH endonuclease [Sciscionella sediminilitoris]|uniref:HNH endonuclease n=1 Tax=Sciscionella sediminilitoris TaxID=1445613 RepID=UPI00068EC02F|nr:HNH endonuclease signature motif containing protein [Sciscionella sp. SE31]
MNETRARQIVKDRAGLWCERCGYVQAAEWHHRKNRSQGGHWAPANGMWLCSPCHRYVTEHPDEAVRFGWACRSWMNPAAVPVLTAWHGWVLLDDLGHYVPVLEPSDAA